MTKEGVCTPKAWTGTAGAPAGPEPQASQPHKEAPPRTSKRLFSAQTPHCLMCACGSARDRCRAARFPVQLPGLGGEGDGSSPGSDRGGPGARGPKPGRGGLCSLRPIRTQACPDGRLGALPGPGGGGGFGALIVKKPVDPAGGVENPVAPARDATSLREGFPHLLGRAHPPTASTGPTAVFLNTLLTAPRFTFRGGVKTAPTRLAASYPIEAYAFITSLKRKEVPSGGKFTYDPDMSPSFLWSGLKLNIHWEETLS